MLLLRREGHVRFIVRRCAHPSSSSLLALCNVAKPKRLRDAGGDARQHDRADDHGKNNVPRRETRRLAGRSFCGSLSGRRFLDTGPTVASRHNGRGQTGQPTLGVVEDELAQRKELHSCCIKGPRRTAAQASGVIIGTQVLLRLLPPAVVVALQRDSSQGAPSSTVLQ